MKEYEKLAEQIKEMEIIRKFAIGLFSSVRKKVYDLAAERIGVEDRFMNTDEEYHSLLKSLKLEVYEALSREERK